MMLCRIFNINPVVLSAVFTLVMDIIAVDRPRTDCLVTAIQAPEISVIIIRCYNACAVALGTFHLDAGGEGAVNTMGKIRFINNPAHTPTRFPKTKNESFPLTPILP